MKFKKTIFTGFAPNLTIKDVFTALRFLFLPWNWSKLRTGNAIQKVEDWLQNYFKINHAITFDSGRSALHFSLKALGIKEGTEVILQAFTCVVVVNAIKLTGATPVYVDIDNSLNISPEDLTKKITQKTKAIIIQHTFGTPAQIDKILKIADCHNLKIIEDCAHSLGANYNGQKLGTFGDIAILSFGSDKVVSCNRGGAAITNNKKLANKLNEFRKRLPPTSYLKIIQHLLHFPLFFIGKKLYSFGVGKWILFLVKKWHITNRIIYQPEKQGKQVLFYPAQLPNCLALILLDQLKNITIINNHRKKIAQLYNDKINNPSIRLSRMVAGAIYLRYNLLTDKPDVLKHIAKKQNIIFGDWYNTVIAPRDTDIKQTDYKLNSCPYAEKFAWQSVNLPTNRHISTKDAQRVIKVVNSL